jgi:hypothetical protein
MPTDRPFKLSRQIYAVKPQPGTPLAIVLFVKKGQCPDVYGARAAKGLCNGRAGDGDNAWSPKFITPQTESPWGCRVVVTIIADVCIGLVISYIRR